MAPPEYYTEYRWLAWNDYSRVMMNYGIVGTLAIMEAAATEEQRIRQDGVPEYKVIWSRFIKDTTVRSPGGLRV